jgi:integrase
MKEKLTEKSVKNLTPPQPGPIVNGKKSWNTYVRYDSELRGFGVRVTENGTKTFLLTYTLNGRQSRYIIGFFPTEHSALSARKKAEQLRQMIRDGVDPVEQRELEEQAKLSERSFKELADTYLERHAINKRPASVRDDKSMLNGILIPRFGQRVVSALTQRDVEILMRDLKPTPYRANRVRSLLSKMFSLAIGWKWVTVNPVKGVPKYPEEKRETWLTVEQLAKLERALAAFSNQDSANVIRLLIETGSRCGEVLNARWEQFDLKRQTWTKPSSATKQKTEEHVPLSDASLKVLKKMGAKKDGYLFPGEGSRGKKARVSIKWCWQQVCKDAELAREVKVPGVYKELSRWRPTIRLHDLRHTFASHLVSSGVSLPIIGKLLGHRQPSTTARYAHVADDAARQAANQMGNRGKS